MKHLSKMLLGVLIGGVLVSVALPTAYRDMCTLMVWFVVPGIMWSIALWSTKDECLEQVVSGFGITYVLNTMILLILQYFPGPLPPGSAYICLAICVAFPVALILKRRKSLELTQIKIRWPLILILLVGSFFRVGNAAYSEFEGDEALILLQAAESIGGRDDMLFWHKKGPVELLIPMLTWLGHGTVNEAIVRLPFIVMSVLFIVGSFLLSQRWQGKYAQVYVAGLVALNGYFIAYGRIAQYQSVVICMITLAFLCLERGKPKDVFLAGVFAGFAVLAHYDAVMALPALAYRFLTLSQSKWTSKVFWTQTALVTIGGVSIILPFYGPFLLSSGFSMAFSYLVGSRIGDGFLHNNLSNFVSVDAFYNSSYYLLSMSLLVFITGLRGWQRYSSKWVRLLIFVVIVACVTTFIWSDMWKSTSINWAFSPFFLLFMAGFLAPQHSHSQRTLWLWFGVPFLFYLFIVKDPRTHVYNIFPAWILLAAETLDIGSRWVLKRSHSVILGYWVAIGLVAIVLAGYPYFAFVSVGHDYIGHYPMTRPTFYKSLADVIPNNVYFGFPRYLGWKAIGQLYERGELQGSYASNQIPRITHWYTRYAPRTHCPHPDYYLIADPHPLILDSVEISKDILAEDYQLAGLVTVRDTPTIYIYERDRDDISPTVYRAEDIASGFDQLTALDRWVGGAIPRQYVPTDIRFENGIRLLGYHIPEYHVAPGDTFPLTLYWETDELIPQYYSVFVHVIRDGVQQLGVGGGGPNCGASPTPLWVPGDTILDLHEVNVFSEANCDDCGVFIGMYDLFTGERLAVYRDGQKMLGDTVNLTTIEVSSLGE